MTSTSPEIKITGLLVIAIAITYVVKKHQTKKELNSKEFIIKGTQIPTKI